MKTFDRLAWRCSWISPVAWLTGFAALFVYMESMRRQVWQEWQGVAIMVACVSWAVGLLSHSVVQYHAIKAWSFSSLNHRERNRLEVALRFAGGYGSWRDHMRTEHPELRRRRGVTGDTAGSADERGRPTRG